MEDYIERITEIANRKEVIEFLEPNVLYHFDVDKWQVKRILYALDLFKQEGENEK